MAPVFGYTDYAVVLGTLGVSVLIGVYYGFFAKQRTNEDLLLGGKSMGIAPIAASMLVTYLSAVTVLGYPAEVYGYGIQIFMNTVTFVLVVPLSVYFFMIVFYDMKLTSVYEYLEHRFQSKFVRMFASFIFILQMTVFMGVCLFAPSIALSAFMGLELWHSVIGLGLCATIYTSMGGLKAVVWTDVFQLFMVLGGMFAIIVRGIYASGGITEAFQKASDHGRLEFFNFTIDPFMRHNTLNFLLGTGFTIFTLFGTHQPQVQRYCSLPTLKHAIGATAFSIPLNIFTIGLCLLSGIVIFSTYAGCDPKALGIIQRVDAIVPYFVKNELGFIPGMMGLFTACVFSASLSTLSSGLNSLAAVTWEDFLREIRWFRELKPAAQAHLIRLLGIIYGVLSIILAFAAKGMGSILSATITALGALSGPLGAVFAMGILMPFVNKIGATLGILTGFLTMIWITINAFILDKSHIHLPFSTDECPAEILAQYNSTVTTHFDVEPIEWPDKLYTLSYILYPFVGGVITTVVAVFFSILTGGLSSWKEVDPKYIHPLVRRFLPSKKVGGGEKNQKEREMQVLTSDNLGSYTRLPLSPPPAYEKASKETQTQGYYYYSHDTESVTPPPNYINLAENDDNGNRMLSTPSNSNYGSNGGPRPLLYRLQSPPLHAQMSP